MAEYCSQLDHKPEADSPMADNRPEWETVHKIEAVLAQDPTRPIATRDWMLDDVKIGRTRGGAGSPADPGRRIAQPLARQAGGFAAEVRGQYRTLIIGTWVTSVSAALFFALFMRLFFRWIFCPLRTLIHGSREVAGGQFRLPHPPRYAR